MNIKIEAPCIRSFQSGEDFHGSKFIEIKEGKKFQRDFSYRNIMMDSVELLTEATISRWVGCELQYLELMDQSSRASFTDPIPLLLNSRETLRTIKLMRIGSEEDFDIQPQQTPILFPNLRRLKLSQTFSSIS